MSSKADVEEANSSSSSSSSSSRPPPVPQLPPSLTTCRSTAESPAASSRKDHKKQAASAAAAAVLSRSPATSSPSGQTQDRRRRLVRPDSAPARPSLASEVEKNTASFETWRLDFDCGGHGAVRVSEFADIRPMVAGPDSVVNREAYGRPANKRDLGHRCYH
eukprot:TRINITY_DN7817_c0_g1_i10.p1 TRINITY_DN7817_c0_g1~~TRINITY_DN7817_c0_g1_i10.p1  ORF type:complete len:170 (-),score=30.32 TRINITY_DN7817_c0_g1_i10:233-718(-)